MGNKTFTVAERFTMPPCLHEPDFTKPFSNTQVTCKKCGKIYKAKVRMQSWPH